MYRRLIQLGFLVVAAVLVLAFAPTGWRWALLRIRAQQNAQIGRLTIDVGKLQAERAQLLVALAAKANTVYVQAQSVIDSVPVYLTDTVKVREFIDSCVAVLRSCQGLASDVAPVRRVSDAADSKQDTLTTALQADRRRWYHDIGVTLGYGVTVLPADSTKRKLEVRHGWQLTAGYKVFPFRR